MNDKKKSFVLYFDYLAQFEMLSKDEQADLIMTILRYVNGIDPELDSMSGAVRMAFSFIRRRLDEDYEKYVETCKKRSAAAKQAKASNCMQLLANAGDNVVVYDNVDENVNVTEPVCDDVVESVCEPHSGPETTTDNITTTTTVTRGIEFIAPTTQEVREYCDVRNNTIDPQRFVDYYNTKGWMVGNNPMRDWKAAVRIWETREIRNAVREPTPLPSYSRPSYDIGAIRQKTLDKYRNL